MDTETAFKQILWGNGLLVVCCGFYLLWWILAFKPVGAVKGTRSGWLLIPAFAFGLAAVYLILRGASSIQSARTFFPGMSLLIGTIAVYLILLAVTALGLKRQVTTELLLIVGWAALVFAEVNALYGIGRFSGAATVCFFAVTGVCAVVSLICYVLFYSLDSRAGYIDGMIPLLLAAVVMIVLTLAARA